MEKKEIVMEGQQPKKEKLTYEQLENVCHQLSEQARTLYQKLQEANMSNLFKRLDYLFAVVENSVIFEDFNKTNFVEKCIDEIVSSMTITEQPETEHPEESKEE